MSVIKIGVLLISARMHSIQFKFERVAIQWKKSHILLCEKKIELSSKLSAFKY